MLTATNPYLQGLNAALASRLLGLPYAVIITRDYDWDWAVLGKQAFRSVYPSRRVERAVGRWVLRHADLVLADRAYYRDFAVRNGAAPGRAVATRVLADSAFVTARADASFRQRYALGPGPLLTYVGRLDSDKFPLDLVDCLSRVQGRFPSVQLVCAGTGALSGEMRTRANKLGVQANLHLLGSLPLEELPVLLATSDAVVAAHMGYTLIEAGLTGVPIVTYDYDFHNEIVTDGETGYLAPLRDVAALAERVCQVLADPTAARATGARLRERLLREHSLEAVVPLYQPGIRPGAGSEPVTVTVAAAPARLEVRSSTISPAKIYAAALAFWMVTRVLVLAHQGAWPWMNSFVVDAARGIVVGDWLDAVRPQLPAFLGVPIVLAGRQRAADRGGAVSAGQPGAVRRVCRRAARDLSRAAPGAGHRPAGLHPDPVQPFDPPLPRHARGARQLGDLPLERRRRAPRSARRVHSASRCARRSCWSG